MMKLNILNIKNFFGAVNECTGEVNMLRPDGKKVNISRQYLIQNDLQEEYRKNKNYLRINLDIPNPKDYMSIVSYYAGDC
ncbi:ribonuclease HII [Anaerobium acetethylicum]|uniref:Uncharacterized protein n=1 Tax=Anaerobium acetethylicum TaxID=1619234 RepID=A0A1D3TUG9_9FIRM|nr:ribonuclease HII [Anaerobium acetethylicum]SCP97721.1 hypothetical protein SAMN05421730_101331 [Anaerobium acetethylicum]